MYYCLQQTKPPKFKFNKFQEKKNFCLNGYDKSKLSLKEQLRLFAKGPCSPLIIAPGLMATKITVKIDCEKLRITQPHTFVNCGWNACQKQIYEFWKSIPLPIYELWIPSIGSPMSLFAFGRNSSLCFSDLIKPHINIEQGVEHMVIQREGVHVEVFGFSDLHRKDSKCGAASVMNLLPLPIQISCTHGFYNMVKVLETYGYESGLNFQVIPYNFYLSYRKNEFSEKFYENLKRMKKLTGKKSTILAHSMGNLNVLYNLDRMSQQDKDDLVFNYIALAPVYLGAYEAAKTIAAGNSDFQTLWGYLGFHFEGSIRVCSNQLSLYDIFIKNPFLLFKDQQWFQQILQRLKYEEQYPNIQDKGIKFWPDLNEKCFKDNQCNFETQCSIGFKNFENEILIKIGNEQYTLQDIDLFFEKYEFIPSVQKMYDKLYSEQLINAKPGVPVILIYTKIFETKGPFELEIDFEERVQSRQFPRIKNIQQIQGDGTVPSFSAILLPLKWAYEFEQDPINNHPVKIVEYCSIYNVDASIYDTLQPFGPKKITKNDFFGLECDCQLHDSQKIEQQCDYTNCVHSPMVNNLQVVQFVMKVLNANQTVSQIDLDKIELYNEEELREQITVCDHIIGSIFDQQFKAKEL